MRVYLDNCMFNRPFDDQAHIRIRLETEAKLYIQQQIRNGQLELVWSYILEFENDQNPYNERQQAIQAWKRLAVTDVEESPALMEIAQKLLLQGIRVKDALHVACAVVGQAECFFTTDDKLLKKLQSSAIIKALNPMDYIREIGDGDPH